MLLKRQEESAEAEFQVLLILDVMDPKLKEDGVNRMKWSKVKKPTARIGRFGLSGAIVKLKLA
jgi:hypothetical protein